MVDISCFAFYVPSIEARQIIYCICCSVWSFHASLLCTWWKNAKERDWFLLLLSQSGCCFLLSFSSYHIHDCNSSREVSLPIRSCNNAFLLLSVCISYYLFELKTVETTKKFQAGECQKEEPLIVLVPDTYILRNTNFQASRAVVRTWSLTRTVNRLTKGYSFLSSHF